MGSSLGCGSVRIAHSFLFSVLYFVCPVLPVSLDCPFLIAPSFFFNVYLSCVLCTQCCQYHWIVHSWLPLLFSLMFICPVFCVPNVASITGLSILDCPFGFLKRVFPICHYHNPSFLNSWHIIWFVVRVTPRVPRLEQEQLNLPVLFFVIANIVVWIWVEEYLDYLSNSIKVLVSGKSTSTKVQIIFFSYLCQIINQKYLMRWNIKNNWKHITTNILIREVELVIPCHYVKLSILECF